MIKEYLVLLIGLPNADKIKTDLINFEVAEDLKTARIKIQSKLYDAVIIAHTLPDGYADELLTFFPSYRTIMISNGKNGQTKTNGFFKVIGSFDINEMLKAVHRIITKHSQKNNDGLLILLNIKESIKELKTSNDFLKSSFDAVHNRLEKLEKSQSEVHNDFESFKKNREKAEQFFINTVMDIKNAK